MNNKIPYYIVYNIKGGSFMDENETKKVEQEEANVNIENSFLKEKDINVCGLLSFIFSLIGFFTYSIPLGIASIVLGIIGIVKFNAEKQKFKWMGIVGVCIGAVDVVATIVDIIGTLIALSVII